MTSALPGQIRRGVLWGGASSMVLRLGSFIVGIITARIIAPEQFGVFAVALTVYSIVIHLSELGVSAVLMRETEPVDELAPTVVTIALTSSVILAGIMVAIAPWVAEALGSPEATGPIRVISISVILAGVSAVPNALCVREFRQDLIMSSQVANFVTSTAVVIVLALSGGGALALSASQVGGQLVGTVVLVVLAPQRYWPGLNRRRLRELLRFGIPLAGANLFGFSVYNVDYIVIGALLGPHELGLYLLAFNISGWPSSVLNAMVNSVAMPAFARVRHDPERAPHFLYTTSAVVAAVTFPVSALLLALSGPLVLAVYGSDWADAAGPLAALAAFGAVRVFTELFGNVIVAFGRPRLLLTVQAGWLTLLIPAMIVGVSTAGTVGAGLAHLAVIVGFVLPAYLVFLHWTVGTSTLRLMRSVVVPAAASLACGLVAWGMTTQVSGSWTQLALGALAGMVIYAALAGLWSRRALQTARGMWGSVSDPVAAAPD